MYTNRKSALAAVFLVVSGATFTACAVEGSGTGGSNDALTVRVYAAASLKNAFDDMIEVFEIEQERRIRVVMSTDGSSTLATQIIEGAPADVFASADERNMAVVIDAGMATQPEFFATNTLVIAVPQGNPGHVESLTDLANVTTILCAPEVPCGAASMKLLDLAGVQVTAASLEQNVTAVLQKVALNEADAGIVYATDVIGNTDVTSIVPIEAAAIVNTYPIVALKNSTNPDASKAFVDFVLSDQGQFILGKYGFGAH